MTKKYNFKFRDLKIHPFKDNLKYAHRVPYRYEPSYIYQPRKNKDMIMHRTYKRGVKNYVKKQILIDLLDWEDRFSENLFEGF